jgi:hypothetical protein
MEGKKGQKQEFFFQKSTTQANTKSITNTKALSEGLLGSSGFTAPGRLAVALGVVVALERTDMV